MATVGNFQDRFKEFSDIDDDEVQIFLDEAALYMGIDEGRWLVFYPTAHIYLTAHLLTLSLAAESGDDGISAPAKKQEVDDVIVESAIADMQANFDELLSTVYGKRYYSIRLIVFGGIRGA